MNDSPGTALARPSAIEDSALGTTSEFSTELAPTAAAEAARQEVQAAVILAKRFPRNEDEAYANIIKACKRPSFAADAEYSFPRGGKAITGPSIYLAREFARLWGNIRHGCDTVTDSETERTIRAWAWDLQTNTKVTSDASFKKLIQRKRNNETVWLTPDERDLRELTNKHAALAKRNCLLELFPSDMIEDACSMSQSTLKNKAAEDPDALRKSLIKSFGELNVPIDSLERFLGHPLGQCSPDELVQLRAIYKSIKDGNSTWTDYLNGNGGNEDLANKTKAKADALRNKVTPAAENADHVEPEVTASAPPDEDPIEEVDPVEKLRANVQAGLDALSERDRKNLLAGKPTPAKMTEKELTDFAIELNKAAQE